MADNRRTLTVEQIKAKDDRAIAIGPFGSRMKADTYVASGVPVIRGNNISDTRVFVDDFVYVSEQTADELRTCNVFANDLVFPHRGAIGLVGIVPQNDIPRFMLSTSLMKLTCDRELAEPLFVFYFFRSSLGRHALLQHASTVGTPGIGQPLTSLRSIQVPLPPLPEQRAIAHILGALDDKIEMNRRSNETLEAMAQSLFHDWFVAFGPTRAKMIGQEPYLPRDLWNLFPAFLNELDMPATWAKGPASELIDFNPSEPLKKDTVAPYLDMSSLPTVGPWPDEPISRPFGSGMRFRNGDTLLARITPCLENGKTAFIQCLSEGQVAWGSTEYIVMRPKSPVPAGYGYLLARNSGFRKHVIQSMTGTSGRQRAQTESVMDYPVAIPNDHRIWAAFSRLIDPLFAGIKIRAEEITTLATLRDTLLPKLISGEIRVPDVGRILRTES